MGDGLPKSKERDISQAAILSFVVLYATCSSSLSIVNKWAILELPFPGIVTACQFLATSMTVFVLGKLGVVDVEPLQAAKMWQMAPINIVFYLAVFTNGKVLQYSTVETFIAFRSLTPLLVALLDTLARGEPRPSPRTCGCLVAIAAGAASYAHDDANFSIQGYTWAVVYLAIIVTEMVYAKHITSTIQLSTWGLVLYQNTIAMMLWPIASTLSGEFLAISRFVYSDNADMAVVIEKPAVLISSAILPLCVSCFLAVGISFAGWGTRANVSATAFTVLGVACKLATVAMNVVVWDHHASASGQVSIIICIVFSVLYQQSAQCDKDSRKPKSLPNKANAPI
ncbi:hypothetical protein M885DRAFT_621930 [Pelagophyceae sp. CCMP2097]|nr:hypothetical protein M885DRAFT_621930 [Pelagophyceae sp. CCMP2097]